VVGTVAALATTVGVGVAVADAGVSRDVTARASGVALSEAAGAWIDEVAGLQAESRTATAIVTDRARLTS
jgi:hypothetical protein